MTELGSTSANPTKTAARKQNYLQGESMEITKVDELHHYTPNANELLPNYEIKCNYENCTSTFTNNGSYHMHRQRHHKIIVEIKNHSKTVYHCPESDCKYNVANKTAFHFKDLRYLRQHYQKVHLAKKCVCNKCGNWFYTASRLNAHKCGMKFQCYECKWEYETNEALLTHAKRKGHQYVAKKIEQNSGKIPIKRLQKVEPATMETAKRSIDQQTQTDAKRLCVASIQTEVSNCADASADVTIVNDCNERNALDALLKDIETQTEYSQQSAATNTTLDPMLSHTATHMHTQTSDDFFNELGLADIQTQTCWSQHSELDKEHYVTTSTTITTSATTETETARAVYDELFVSTETQTSFTQYFLDSCKSTHGTTTAMTATATNDPTKMPNSFGQTLHTFYNTQYTQTCDTLLGDLFGEQDQHLMISFQSAYTQT